MNKDELTKLCLKYKDAIETYPFKDKSYSKYAVIRHKNNNKWFALIFFLDDTLYLNLKCNPIDASILRDTYPFVTEGWHMNKMHWNKVDVNNTPIELLERMIKTSYELTKNKRTNNEIS